MTDQLVKALNPQNSSTYSGWLEDETISDPSSPAGGAPLSDSGLFHNNSLFQPANNFMASASSFEDRPFHPLAAYSNSLPAE
jgi:hypothetical protein